MKKIKLGTLPALDHAGTDSTNHSKGGERGKIAQSSTILKSRRNLPRTPRPDVSTVDSVIPIALRVLGRTPADGENESQIVLRIKRSNCSFPMSDCILGDGKILRVFLASNGHADLCVGKRFAQVRHEILRRSEDNDAFIFAKNGWHKITTDRKIYSAYVWRRRVHWLGPKPTIKVVVAVASEQVQASCTLEEWQNSVGKCLNGNPYLIVVHAHTLAAAIRRSFNLPRISISLVGTSGVGKTTAQWSAQSQIGPIDDVATLTGTMVGITENLLKKPDCVAFYQDTRQSNPEIFLGLIFNVADGASHMKSGAKSNNISATMILSNERLVADMKLSKKNIIDEGLYARLLELVCNGPHGVFHDLQGFDCAADFANDIHLNSAKYYGAVWPAWILALSENWPRILRLHEKWLPKVKAKIAEQAGEASHDRVNNRILDGLSFSAWVGLVASTLGILPIKHRQIVDAFGLVMKEHISRQSAGSTPFSGQVVSEVRGCLDVNAARFPPLFSFHDANQPANIYGYSSECKRHGTLFLFLPNVFNKLFKEKYGEVAYAILEKEGFLVKNTDRGFQYQKRIPVIGERKSFIAIKAAIRFDQG